MLSGEGGRKGGDEDSAEGGEDSGEACDEDVGENDGEGGGGEGGDKCVGEAGLGTEGGGVKHCSEKLGLRLMTPGALLMGLGTVVSWLGKGTGLMS